MNNLKSAFEETYTGKIISTVPNIPDHVFSKTFERKMARLIKSGSVKSRQQITLKRVATYIVAAILAAVILVLTACATWYIYEKFIMEQKDTHTRVSFVGSEDAPKYIEDVYAIDIPDGFETVYDGSKEALDYEVAIDNFYTNGDENITFSQIVKSAFSSYVNTEGHQIEEITINGCAGFFVNMGDDNYYLAWDNGDYIFEISAHISKDALFELAESVHKAE